MKNWLFVINLYARPSDFRTGLASDDQVVILSTHSLFDQEKQDWRNALGCTVDFLRFDHWNSMLDEVDLDRQAYEACRRLIPFTSIYQSTYFKQVAERKNAFVHQQLIRSGMVDQQSLIRVGCGSDELYNLGISRAYWKAQGAELILAYSRETGKRAYKRLTAWGPLKWSGYLLKACWLSLRPYRVLRVQDGMHRFALLNTRRIQLKADLNTRSGYLIPLLSQWGRYRLAAPIHSNQALLGMYPFVHRKHMVVIQDAFRPTSYPPYYYANSYNGCRMISQDKVDERFFQEAGLDTYPLGTLLARKELKAAPERSEAPIRTICLSLNHAGNWSSLISRCDTDGLIQALIPLAADRPELRFIIRLHPNSARPMAEGSGWIDRIREQLSLLQLPNLEISDRSIEEDWQRADMFLSEYSLSVVDALQFGKLVYFLNLTQRRSFVRDLVEVGFRELHSVEELDRVISDCVAEPSAARQSLAESIANYNRLYSGR